MQCRQIGSGRLETSSGEALACGGQFAGGSGPGGGQRLRQRARHEAVEDTAHTFGGVAKQGGG